MSKDLVEAVVELRRDEVTEIVQRRIERGEEAIDLLEECRRGMACVGERFQAGDYFLSELILAAEIFKAVSTPELRKHVGADFQTIDAGAGVQYCLERAAGRA